MLDWKSQRMSELLKEPGWWVFLNLITVNDLSKQKEKMVGFFVGGKSELWFIELKVNLTMLWDNSWQKALVVVQVRYLLTECTEFQWVLATKITSISLLTEFCNYR